MSGAVARGRVTVDGACQAGSSSTFTGARLPRVGENPRTASRGGVHRPSRRPALMRSPGAGGRGAQDSLAGCGPKSLDVTP